LSAIDRFGNGENYGHDLPLSVTFLL